MERGGQDILEADSLSATRGVWVRLRRAAVLGTERTEGRRALVAVLKRARADMLMAAGEMCVVGVLWVVWFGVVVFLAVFVI